MRTKHLRAVAYDDDGNPLDVDVDLYCDRCGAEHNCLIAEPNSFKDLYEEMSIWRQEHAGCPPPEGKAKPKKKKTEPDPMATAQASVLRERMGKLA